MPVSDGLLSRKAGLVLCNSVLHAAQKKPTNTVICAPSSPSEVSTGEKGCHVGEPTGKYLREIERKLLIQKTIVGERNAGKWERKTEG